ncbi:MAG: UDP-N-acetylglucosamine 2-epimerase (non-hydrolyzing) [Cytophagales bacterium]|nr:UDP-N-acetylglucosamine 2-epimerase (non-hydrolyzing) [Cytophagales bacterium]
MGIKKKILIVVGTRPNIIKVTQFKKLALRSEILEVKIVHTGQHYDKEMASSFFDQLGVNPDFFLNVPATSANEQIAHILMGLEKVCAEYGPDMIMAVGDVNSTLAASLAANKIGIRLAHLEAGLRSHDRGMPEEHNRIITDYLSDIFFVTEVSGRDNLILEGKQQGSIHWVGNTMIDTLIAFEKEIMASDILEELGVQKSEYVLITMHRPSNVDSQEGLEKIISLIAYFCDRHKVIFPAHPRTLSRIKEFNLQDRLEEKSGSLLVTEPKDYFSFQRLIADCKFVVTDSGGIQEETTFRGVPCFTLRSNTERPSTLVDGTNVLATFDNIRTLITDRMSGTIEASVPPLWDGKATERIIAVLERELN